jgi:hypothetical protein
MTPEAPRFALIQTDMAVPRLALTRAEAAAALGVSIDSFKRYVQPDVRVVRRGSVRLIPVAELERWLEANAERVLGDAA